jgi:hypothetical protein
MAVGDVKAGLFQIVGLNNTAEIKPPAGEEWVIHNLYYNYACEFQMVEGTTVIPFDSDTSSGARLGMVFHLTNTHFLRIKNNQGLTLNFAYDGVQTK